MNIFYTGVKSNHVIIISALIIASFTSMLFFIIPSASAASCVAGATPATIDCSISASSVGNIVSLRDVTDTSNVTKTSTAQFDKTSYSPGNSGTVTITDFYANLDSSIQDKILVTLTSRGDPTGISLIANETGPSTGAFTASFTTTLGSSNGTSLHVIPGDIIGVSYSPVPVYAPRFQLTFDNAGVDGNAIQSDQKLSSDDEINNGFSTVIESENFTLANGVALNPGSTEHVVISYANSQLGCLVDPLAGCNTNNLSLWVSPPSASPFHTFVEIADASTVTNDPIAQTISFDTDLTSLDGQTSGTWFFVLAFDSGGIGGGGGGVVRAGLIVDILAGIGGASEHAIAPPSFGGSYYHYSDGLTFTQGKNTTTFDTSKYNQELPRQVMVTGTPVNMTFKTFEAYNPEKGVIGMTLYIIPRGKDLNMDASNSIASIEWKKGAPVEVDDQSHILSGAKASSTTDGKFQYTQFSFVPAKSYDKMSFLARAWNDHLQTTEVRVHDDLNTPLPTKTLPTGVIKYDNFNDLQATIEKEGFYKPTLMSHIHDTNAVFAGSEGGSVYWLYDTIKHCVTLVISDKDDNNLFSNQAVLEPYAVEKKGDYKFMHFTFEQLNRWDEAQEQKAMELEAQKAMSLAIEKGIAQHKNW